MRVRPWSAPDGNVGSQAWDDLAATASEPNPFHERWYLDPALRALDPRATVMQLQFFVDHQLTGLLPLRRMSQYYRWPVPHIGTWCHGNSFLGAPLVQTGKEPAFWRAVLNWADHNAGTSLFLHLSAMPLDQPLYAALSELCAEQGRQLELVHREERAVLASPLSPTAYFEASLSGKKRKELRRQHARLSELGNLSFERRTDDHGLADWIADFLALEHSGWKGMAGSALASHHSTAELFRAALHGAAAQQRLERLTLSLNDAPIAMLVNFLTPPGSFSFKTAFDERFARFSPGVLLQRENLALLDRTDIAWCDSCAAANHPMIDHIWRERRAIGRLSVAIGRPVRRALFARLVRTELARNPAGV